MPVAAQTRSTPYIPVGVDRLFPTRSAACIPVGEGARGVARTRLAAKSSDWRHSQVIRSGRRLPVPRGSSDSIGISWRSRL